MIPSVVGEMSSEIVGREELGLYSPVECLFEAADLGAV